MNEWLTVITSPPGFTPTASSARCSATVQLETAQAYSASTSAANSFSKPATWGPCDSQPERIAACAASASSRPTKGRVIGIKTPSPLGPRPAAPPATSQRGPLSRRHVAL